METLILGEEIILSSHQFTSNDHIKRELSNCFPTNAENI